MEAFLTQNPSEIVTIIIEDYVRTPKGLTRVFTDAGLDKYWYPVAKMPRKGEDWPTVNSMVKDNHRLLVFTSDSSKEAAEGIAYQWKYMVENERKHINEFVGCFACAFGLMCLCNSSAHLILCCSGRSGGGAWLMPKQKGIEAT